MKFLFVGRPTWTKGLPDLILSLERLAASEWTLTIVGDWSRTALPEFARRDPRCRLLGAVVHSRVVGLMHDSDAVVVPSRYENFCNVALEAMAAGRAVVGSRCGGIPDLVENEVTGLLFEPGSIAELQNRLEAALREPRSLSRMGYNGWKKAQSYSWEQIGRETDALFRWISGGTSSALVSRSDRT